METFFDYHFEVKKCKNIEEINDAGLEPLNDIIEAATRATLDLLPRKSRIQYEVAYSKFV